MRLIIALLMAAVCSSMAYAKPTYIHLGKHVAKGAYPRAERGRKNFSPQELRTTKQVKPKKPNSVSPKLTCPRERENQQTVTALRLTCALLLD